MDFVKRNCINLVFLLFNLMVMVSFFSCLDTGKKNEVTTSKTVNPIKRKPASSFSDTIVINYPAAVFYSPDTLQLEKIKSVTEPGIFESLNHDCYYQMRYSRIAINKYWPDVKIVEIKKARFILFSSKEGSREYLDLDTKNDPCGVLLFDGHKKAQLADMTNIESELGFYFQK